MSGAYRWDPGTVAPPFTCAGVTTLGLSCPLGSGQRRAGQLTDRVPVSPCPAPVLVEALIQRKDESHGGTEAVMLLAQRPLTSAHRTSEKP
ncbi:hypothetical protein GCM10011589_47370 [Modestobacter marinus]|uniref:Uncharacterized protein n=1 Tax=Modestobacter marinus TaxID=477641 RepID=A0ABQ2GBU1_9ACTN|nr:hypothetical protein GCM10011589_47370 [Modestobacter marinus]